MRVIGPVVAKLEKIMALNPFLTECYLKPYQRVVAQELALAEAKQGQLIVNIGCGSIPFTAIIAAKLTNNQVLAVDCDLKTVQQATKVVQRLNLSQQIEVIKARGETLKLINFDLAIIALQAEPKEAIINNLLQQANHQQKIVVRQPVEKLRNFYDAVPACFKISKIVQQKMATFKQSLLIENCHQIKE